MIELLYLNKSATVHIEDSTLTDIVWVAMLNDSILGVFGSKESAYISIQTYEQRVYIQNGYTHTNRYYRIMPYHVER